MNRTNSAAHRALIKHLIEIRLSIGLTQNDLADILNVQPSLIGRIESGERRVDVIEVAHLARALKADPVSLMELVRDTLPDDELW
jgi:transcriptional regulator with XRE-family HTH domain